MAKETVKLKKYVDIINEYPAAAAITPGMLIELTSAGTVQAHSVAGGNCLPMFALEDELQGNGLEDVFAAADRVQCWIPTRGDEVYGILEDGATAVIGSFLESNGAGYLQVHVADVGDSTVGSVQNAIVGIALEALDLSDSSGTETSAGVLGYNKRIALRII